MPLASIPRPLRLQFNSGRVGAVLLLAIALPCFVTLPWSLTLYDATSAVYESAPTLSHPMGTDAQGRSLWWRCMLGGAISLSIGISAALISVVVGVTWGCIAGYAGGRIDAVMMRIVDVLYSLPYILLVMLIHLALTPVMESMLARWMPGWMMGTVDTRSLANVLTLLVAIGSVSWLTLSRVIRGQVLSLREQPFMEAARAVGAGPWRMLRYHLLPNLMGPIIVYTTLTVPAAILQESFLSFLGIGVQQLPSWGLLASEGLGSLHALGQPYTPFRWWLIVWPCVLLGLTLLALNFLGDGLRDRLDPRSRGTQ